MARNRSKGVIVIIENDEGIAAFLEETIREFVGKRTVVAHDGETGLAVIRRVRPQVVLTDITLPGMSGIMVFDALQASPETATIPVIFMSSRYEFRREMHQRGVKHFLEKPFALDHLLSVLTEVLNPPQTHAA